MAMPSVNYEYGYHRLPLMGCLYVGDKAISFDMDGVSVDTIHPVVGEVTTFEGSLDDEGGEPVTTAMYMGIVKREFKFKLYREFLDGKPTDDYYAYDFVRPDGY